MIISDISLILRNSMDFVTVPASEFPHIGFQRLCGNRRLATNTCRCWARRKGTDRVKENSRRPMKTQR